MVDKRDVSLQKDIEGPLWIVRGKRIVGYELRACQLVVRSKDSQGALDRALEQAVRQNWVEPRFNRAELY